MREVSEGIYQGDTSDLNSLPINLGDTTGRTVAKKYGITLAVNVGSTPFVPRGIPTLYVPMMDITDRGDPQRPLNRWPLIIDAARVAAREVKRGGRILVNCDAGISRSVVFVGIVMTILKRGMMDEDLKYRIRSPADTPSNALWEDARNALKQLTLLAL